MLSLYSCAVDYYCMNYIAQFFALILPRKVQLKAFICLLMLICSIGHKMDVGTDKSLWPIIINFILLSVQNYNELYIGLSFTQCYAFQS